MNFGLIVGEALIGLRRNISMVISVVLVTFVSLTFVGAAILMQTQIQTMRGYWGEKAEVTIYMCSPLSTSQNCTSAEATAEQIKTVEDDLAGPALSPLITEVTYEDKETTFKNWVERFGEEQANAFGVENMGVAFRVTMKDPQQSRVLTEAFSGKTGVDEVQDQRRLLDPLFSALTVATYIAVGVAALMLIAAVLGVRQRRRARRGEVRSRGVSGRARAVHAPAGRHGGRRVRRPRADRDRRRARRAVGRVRHPSLAAHLSL